MLSERNFARQIDLTSLQLFVAVCELGSIGRAAEREFIAASAISKRLSDLENTLGTTLLHRHARGVRLTPAGEGLLHHARAVLFGLEKMQVELAEYADGVRGHVRVHASISAIVQFLPEDLGAFARSHPQIKIDLEEHLSAEVMRAVMEGATDLGLCNGATGMGSLQSLPYRRDSLVLVVPCGHPLAGEASIAFAATLPYDHVGLHANSSIHLTTHQAAVQAGAAVRVRIRVTGLDAMCRMIANGLGVGVMPERAFHLLSTDDTLRAVPLTDPWAQRQLVIVARDFSSLPATARLLIEHLTTTDAHRPS